MKSDAKIGPVLSHSFDPHILRLVQCVDQLLLDTLIESVIQRVQLQDAVEDLFKILPDFRHRKSDDGKASLFALHILIHQRARLRLETNGKLLLLFVQAKRFFLVLRLKGRLPKAFDDRRPAVHGGKLLHALQRIPIVFQAVVHIPLVIKQRLVVFVIIFKLLVGNGAIVAVLSQLPAFQNALGRPVNDGFQPDSPEIFHRPAHHALKAEEIADIDGFFLCNVLARHREADPIPFRIGVRHQSDFFFRKAVQIARHAQLVFRNILSKTVQIAQIGKVAVHNDPQGEILFPVKGRAHVLFQHGFGIVAGKPVQRLLHLRGVRKAALLFLCAHKHLINFQEQFQTDYHGFHVLLISKGDQAAHLRRQEGKHLSELLSQRRHGKPGIGIAFPVMLRKHIRIEPLISSCEFLQRSLL